MSRRNPYRRPKKPPPMRLTERDVNILEDIHSFEGMLSLKQIDHMYYSGKGRTQPRQRMRTLFANAYVQIPNERNIHRVPLGETIYWLGRKGAEVVASKHSVTLSEFSWRRTPRWSTIEHDLDVNNFRIQIQQACATSPDLTLHPWVPETDFLASPDTVHVKDKKGVDRKRQIRPDGFFLIARTRKDRTKPEGFAFLLEIDRAKHINPSFERDKVRAGLAYLASESYETRFGLEYGRWLVVTTSQPRLDHLLQQTERAGGGGLFFFATFDQIAEVVDRSNVAVLTEPIWLVAGSRKLTPLIPDANVSAG